MAPCADCWKRGDRRLANEERHRADRREQKRINAKDGKLHFRTRGKNEQDKGEELALPISPKPLATPHLNKDLDRDRVHRWLLSEENNFDCSRVCDPVKLGSMGKDYRAARVSTDWYAVEGEFGFSFFPCGFGVMILIANILYRFVQTLRRSCA
jgi:hypothetical protein